MFLRSVRYAGHASSFNKDLQSSIRAVSVFGVTRLDGVALAHSCHRDSTFQVCIDPRDDFIDCIGTASR